MDNDILVRMRLLLYQQFLIQISHENDNELIVLARDINVFLKVHDKLLDDIQMPKSISDVGMAGELCLNKWYLGVENSQELSVCWLEEMLVLNTLIQENTHGA